MANGVSISNAFAAPGVPHTGCGTPELIPECYQLTGSRVTRTVPLPVKRITFTVFARSGEPE